MKFCVTVYVVPLPLTTAAPFGVSPLSENETSVTSKPVTASLKTTFHTSVCCGVGLAVAAFADDATGGT